MKKTILFCSIILSTSAMANYKIILGNGKINLPEETVPQTDFTSHVFTNCGQERRRGPSQSQCINAYSNLEILESEYNFNVSQGIQSFKIPVDGTYRIDARGASGAHQNLGSGAGGKGARISGNFELNAGDVIHVVVGQKGHGGPDIMSGDEQHPGGGGGTFIYIDGPPNDPLIVAGGGAGVNQGLTSDAHGQDNVNAGLANTASNASYSGLPGQHVRIGEGSWITGSNIQCSGGGAGWLSRGASSYNSGSYGVVKDSPTSTSCGGSGQYGRFINSSEPFIGGFGTSEIGNEFAHVGGFGGGGGGGNGGEGGGGGYTGGAGTYAENLHGGGAGSFNGGVNQVNETGANVGHGSVTIEIIP